MQSQRRILNASRLALALALLVAFGLSQPCLVFGQEQQAQTMVWMQKTQQEFSSLALQKMSASLRILPNASVDFLQMQAQVLEIRALETGDPVVGVLVKSAGSREELEAVGARVGAQLGDIFSVRIPLNLLDELASLANVVRIEPSRIRKFTLDLSIKDVKADAVHQADYTGTNPVYNGIAGEDVLVGIFDTGLDWQHGDFINDADGTSRVVSIWDQTLEPVGSERNPEGFSYGVEYTQAHLNDELDGAPAGFVRTTDDMGHGTHVAGIAAGDGSATGNATISPPYTFVGMAPRADIVVIRASNAATGDFSPSLTEQLDAIEYLMKKSDELGKPGVLNLSLGSHFGPHDGTELESQAIDAAISTGKINIVVAAGNEGTNLSRGEYIHAEGTVAAGTRDTTEFVVPSYTQNPGTFNDFFLFNMWYQGNDRLTVKVVSPRGYSWEVVSGSNRNFTFINTLDGAIFIDNAAGGIDSGNGDKMCFIQIFDYRTSRPPRAGAWKIIVTGATVTESGHYDDWLAFSQVGNKSVYFDSSSASLDELVGIPGVAEKAITVGAYSTKTSWVDYLGNTQTFDDAVLNDLAYFSSPGPTRDDPGFLTGRQKPEISTPGYGVIAALSQNAPFQSSTRRNQDQVHLMLMGTSMSTPHITGAVALLLAKNPKLTPSEVKNLLMAHARSDAFTGTVPNFNWGAGKLDIEAAVNAVVLPDRAVKIFPSDYFSYALAATTAEYKLTVKNLGALADDYNLAVAGNAWTIKFYDASGTNLLSNTGTLQPDEQRQFLIRVDVPSGTAADQQDLAEITVSSTGDAAVKDSAAVETRTPGGIPWSENFTSTSINAMKWPVNLGPVEVNTTAKAEPSSPYSMNLNGNARGFDEIRSQALNIIGMNGVKLEFFYERTGNGDSPESGDDLKVDYFNNAGEWINLKRYSGSGSDMSTFTKETIILPTAAHHAFFQLRFRSKGTRGPNDDWFVDNISLTPPPEIDVTHAPDPMDFRLNFEDSSTAAISIANRGLGPLNYQISDIDSVSSAANLLAKTGVSQLESVIEAMRSRALLQKTTELTISEQLTGGVNGNTIPLGSDEVVSVMYAPQATSRQNVALLGAESNSTRSTDVRNTLLATGRFASVTIVNTYAVTPGISDLRVFDAVLVWSNASFLNSTLLGNNLADYVDGGGGVVVAMWAAGTTNSARYLRGRFLSDDYYTINVVDYLGSANLRMGTIHQPGHPIMQGVKSFRGGSHSIRPSGGLTSGATRIVDWSDGKILVATKSVKGHRRADLGFWPITTRVSSVGWDPSTDGGLIMANALEWVAGTAISDWLSFDRTSGTVTPKDSVVIHAKIRTANLIPGRDYFKKILIASNDPNKPVIQLPVSLHLNPEPYFVAIEPKSASSEGFATDTVAYQLLIQNFGQNMDIYNVTASGNSWQTQILDSTGTANLATTPVVPANGSLKFLVRVIIDASAGKSTEDVATITVTSQGNVKRTASANLVTTSSGIRIAIPFSDSFPSTSFSTKLWATIKSAFINTTGSNEPSPPYSANLNYVDEIESHVIDLSGQISVMLRYYYERGGNGESPDAGDDLLVGFMDETGNWVTLKRYFGSGSVMANYALEDIILPATAYHKNFVLRFRTNGDRNADDWYIDDVFLGLPSPVAVTPVRFDVFLAPGDSTKQTLTVSNQGGQGSADVNFSVSSAATWLSFSPISGTLPPGASQNVAVIFDAQSLPADTLFATDIVVNSNGIPQTITIPAKLHTSPQCTAPTHFTFAANTGHSYAIAINKAMLDGIVLDNCDEIGVFAETDSGQICVGASVATGTWPLGLVAWQDDDQTSAIDGYQPGQKMIFRVYDFSAGTSLDYPAEPTYSTGDGTFGFGVFSEISHLEATTRKQINISLRSGWNWISSNIVPEISDVDSVMQEVENLGLMQSCTGQFYIPGKIDLVGNFEVLDSYQLWLTAPDTLVITGQQMPVDTPISLPPKWVCPSYLPQVPLSPEVALETLMPNLSIVQDDQGKFMIPGQINTIGLMQPGKGYKMHLLAADTLIYPRSDGALAKRGQATPIFQMAIAKHFTVTRESGESYSLVIESIRTENAILEPGDEIGVFSESGQLVGAGVWSGQGPLPVAVWLDDSHTEEVDGLQPGEKIVFRLYDADQDKEIAMEAVFHVGNEALSESPYAIAELHVLEIPEKFGLEQNYPNPFNPSTKIRFGLPQSGRVQITIFNILGQKVRTLVDQTLESGYHEITWGGFNDAGQQVTSGIYFYLMKAEGFVARERMVLMR